MQELWLIRHGETAWSTTRRHTGRTDIPLTPRGELQGELLRRRLREHVFSLVLTSPLRRARDTCAIAGYADRALIDADLSEWDYGNYEGITTAEIRRETPNWDIWSGGAPGGESVAQVGARADRVMARARDTTGDVALFAHAHLLRVLAARWLGMGPDFGRFFAFDTAAVSVLGYEYEHRVVQLWNDVSHLSNDAPTQPNRPGH